MKNFVKISDVIKNYKEEPSVFHILVDTDDELTPPEKLKEVSILAEAVDGTIKDEILDFIISYRKNGVSTILEVDMDTIDLLDSDYLFNLAGNIGTAISLLPPIPKKNEEYAQKWKNYEDKLIELIDVFYSKPNFDQYFIPFTNHLEYIYVKTIKPSVANDFTITDPYIKDLFENVDVGHINSFKEKIEKHLHEKFGGEKEFKSHFLALAQKTIEETKENAKLRREDVLSQAKQIEENAEEYGRTAEDIYKILEQGKVKE